MENITQLKEFLKLNNIKYPKLAEKSNIPLSTIKNIFADLSRNPRIDTYKALEKAAYEIAGFSDIQKPITELRLTKALNKAGCSIEDLANLNDTELDAIITMIKAFKSSNQ